MHLSRRGRGLEEAFRRAHEHAGDDASVRVDEVAVRLDRLSALRTAGLISEEDFADRCAELLGPGAA